MNTEAMKAVANEVGNYANIKESTGYRGERTFVIYQSTVDKALEKLYEAFDFFGDSLQAVESCPREDGCIDLNCCVYQPSRGGDVIGEITIEISPEGKTVEFEIWGP